MDDNSSERNTELNTEELVVVSKEEEAHLALKELPDYVADSFMTTGYDTLLVISRMDTSRNPGNALEEVEQYISTEFIDDPCFRRGVTHRGTSSFCQVTDKGLLILWTKLERA